MVTNAHPTYCRMLASFRSCQFVDDQHRNVPRLRARAPDPFIGIHPDTAGDRGIRPSDWVDPISASVPRRARMCRISQDTGRVAAEP